MKVCNATQNGRTSLVIASLKGHVAVVRLLLEKGAGFNICNKVSHKYRNEVSINFIVRCTQNGFSPVYVASEEGHTNVVELLVQAGADIHLATTDEVCKTQPRLRISGRE